MLKPFEADLHLHTVLSPCADYRMVPELIIDCAVQRKLDLIGVTDHNSGENAAAVMAAAAGSGVAVLPGMEVESREGVHILTLFDDLDALSRWQDAVYRALPDRENVERVFGAQLVVDASGQLVRVVKRLLITSTDLSLEDLVDRCEIEGGLAIPSHIDRPANGLLGVLGMLPANLKAPALEISPRISRSQAATHYPGLAGWPLIQSSDAHTLEDIGRVSTTLLLEAPLIGEIVLACRQEQGRQIITILD